VVIATVFLPFYKCWCLDPKARLNTAHSISFRCTIGSRHQSGDNGDTPNCLLDHHHRQFFFKEFILVERLRMWLRYRYVHTNPTNAPRPAGTAWCMVHGTSLRWPTLGIS